MAKDTMTREEFDRRLEASTERIRQECLVLEAQAAEIETLVVHHTAVLESLNAVKTVTIKAN